MGHAKLLTLCILLTETFLSPQQGLCEPATDLIADVQRYIAMEADQLDHDREGKTITAVGGVHLDQGDEYKLNADQAVYHTGSRRIDAVGNVYLLYQKKNLSLRTDKATYDTVARALEIPGKVDLQIREDKISGRNLHLLPTEDRGTLEDMVLDMAGPGGRATAATATIHDANTMTLTKTTFTNCDCEDPPWHLDADSLYLDKEDNQMVAQHAALYLKGVPIAYSPWWQNPLFKKRKSGFLTPGFGLSSSNGLEVDIPYYVNIAPDKDATLTLHPTLRRGVLVKGQFRYLGSNYLGTLENQSIYDARDDIYRGLTLVDHKHNVDEWRLEAKVQHLQTRDFLKDFHVDSIDARGHYLTSDLLAQRVWSRPGGISQLNTGMTWFQDLEALNDQSTLQRLPYARLTDIRPLAMMGDGWFLDSTATMDSFYRLAGDSVQRLDLAPAVGFRYPLYVGALSGNLGVRETVYWSQYEGATAPLTQDDFASRQSSHARLRLDGSLSRVYHGDNNASYRHSVEPAIQYVMNAANNQREVPTLTMDTTRRDLTVTNLFTQHLFSGPDRIVNGQWLAYGFTSRLTGPRWGSNNVGEMVSLTIGQRWAPTEDREFQRQQSLSDVVSSLDIALSDRWSFSTGSLIDPYSGIFSRLDNTLSYNSERGDTLSMGHHFDRRLNSEDAVLVANIKLTEQWSWLQEGDYSLERSSLNNWKSGLMYEHECWSAQFLAGKRLLLDTNQHGGGWVGFLINFKGLGDYGLRS